VTNKHHEGCGTVSDPVLNEPGVLSTALDTDARSLTIRYDPEVISDKSVCQVLERLAPDARQRLDKCVMRLGGRACEACALNLEKKAAKINGVRRATATFIGGVMSVTFDNTVLTEEQVLRNVRATGANVTPFKFPPGSPRGIREWLAYHVERIEVACTVATLLFMIAGWLAPRVGMNHGWAKIFFIMAYMAGGIFGVQAGIRSLRQWTVDVDLLMILAALGAAYVGAPFEGAMLLFLFSLSNVLQAYAIDRTRRAIHSLIKLRPEKALTRRDGTTVELPIGQLAVGDIVIVRPGESIALDSVIVEGESAINESSLTGESMPVMKKAGDPVFAATINQTGGLEVRVTKLAKDSTIEKLIRMVEEAQSEKADTQRFLDRAEQYYAAGVICFTLALILYPFFFMHEPFSAVFYRAMTVMVVASPCALIISTPASILSAIGGAARRGVLFKGGVHLERMATIEAVAFDKTGTLTQGKPRVTDIICEGSVFQPGKELQAEARELLRLAAAVEVKSEHPLAGAIVAEAKSLGIMASDCSAFQSVSGNGASGLVGERLIAVGSVRYFETLGGTLDAGATLQINGLEENGRTCVLVCEIVEKTARFLGAIAVADTLREEATEVVCTLRAMGMKHIVMITGDNCRVAAAIARQAGVDEFHAGLLPEDKVSVINFLKTKGPVAMVGDGINDAPALATATVGVAMGAAGTDVAMETADLVLMSDNLRNIPFAISISRKARSVVRQNLLFAMLVIFVLVISALGFSLPLPVGVLGHEGSTVLVCLNGLRLLAFRR